MIRRVLFSVCVVLLIVGCAKKEISTDENSMVTQEENIQPNVVSAPEEPEEEKKTLEDGTIIGSVYFDFDKFSIKPDMQSVIDESISTINENSEMKVLIEGNTDEFGSDEYNFALGNKRALAVKSALVLRGVDKDAIQVVSLGKTKPICTDKTPECYQKNRRGDIRLVK